MRFPNPRAPQLRMSELVDSLKANRPGEACAAEIMMREIAPRFAGEPKPAI